MKQVLHLCSKIRGYFSASQSNDVGYDSRLTVVRPSFDCRSTVLKLCSVLVFVLMVGVGNVWGADPDYQLTFSQLSTSGTGNQYNSSYTNAHTITNWSIIGNQTVGAYLRVGGKSTSAADVVALTSTANNLTSAAVSMIVLNHTATGGSSSAVMTLNSVTLEVSSTSNFSSITETITRTSPNKTDTVRFVASTAWAKTSYYRFTYNYKSSKNDKNVYVQLDNVDFYCESVSPSYTITAASNNNSYGTVSLSGSVITATPADCYGYASTAYSVSPSGKATVTQGTGEHVNEFTVSSLTDNVTVTINFEARGAGKTVNFNAGPGVSSSSSLTETCDGSGVTLPAVTASGVCKGWTTFAGWKTSAINDSTTTNPGTLYAAGSKYTPSSNNETLYAVYRKIKSGGASWTLCTSAPSTGDSLMVAYYTGSAYKYMKNSGADNDDLTVVAGVATPVANGKFKLVSGDSYGVSLQNGSNYLHLNSSSINVTTARTNGDINISSGSSSNSFIIKRHSGASTYDRVLTWNGSANPPNWATSDNMSNGCEVYFFKKTTSTTYYCSDPNCCTPLGSINGSFF